jgi:hypothetical protein
MMKTELSFEAIFWVAMAAGWRLAGRLAPSRSHRLSGAAGLGYSSTMFANSGRNHRSWSEKQVIIYIYIYISALVSELGKNGLGFV